MNTSTPPPPLVSVANARRKEIAALAESIARTHCPEGPVEPEKIAAREGIAVLESSLPDGIEGTLLYEQGKFFLVSNTRHAQRGSTRQRFTFAHELGHYFIAEHRAALMAGMTVNRTPQPGSYNRMFDLEAHAFAASLLMPAPAFVPAFAKSELTGLALIRSLAEQFVTSLTSTAYRAIELDLFAAPAVVMLWDSLGNPVGRRVSFETSLLGEDYRTLPDAPPPGTRTASVIERMRSDLREGPAQRTDWFINLRGYNPDDFGPLHEEVVSLGFHGWMTLLHDKTLDWRDEVG